MADPPAPAPANAAQDEHADPTSADPDAPAASQPPSMCSDATCSGIPSDNTSTIAKLVSFQA